MDCTPHGNITYINTHPPCHANTHKQETDEPSALKPPLASCMADNLAQLAAQQLLTTPD